MFIISLSAFDVLISGEAFSLLGLINQVTHTFGYGGCLPGGPSFPYIAQTRLAKIVVSMPTRVPFAGRPFVFYGGFK